RLHLNLPGLPQGSALDVKAIADAIDQGVHKRPYQPGGRYFGFCDMSGGSDDYAVLAIAYLDEDNEAVLACLVDQGQAPPFHPRQAVARFARVCKEYGTSWVAGDAYGGQTFRQDFKDHGIVYEVCEFSASELYEMFEPHLNAGEVAL